jgi:DNA-binding CsgD family transcriptional regulator
MEAHVSRDTVSTLRKFIVKKAPYSDIAVETDPVKITDCISFMERVFTDVVVVVCGHDRVHYVGENCLDIIGYESSFFKSLTLDETVGLLYPEDIKGFKSCVEKMLTVQTERYDEYKFIFYYRMKNPKTGYCRIMDEKIAIETSPGKYVFLTLIKNISHDGNNSVVKLLIQKKKNKNKFVTIDEFVPLSGAQRFSARQHEIMELVSKGLSNKEIAARLNLSIYTVKNHKQLLFRKVNVKSSIAMLNSVKRNWLEEGRNSV